MAKMASYIKHPDRIALIHHKNTGDMMTQLTHAAHPMHRTIRAKGSVLGRFVQAYAAWQQRKQLATLDDAALTDIGITRAQAQAEAARPLWTAPVWNAPAQWLR